MASDVLVWGGSGHAKVLRPTILAGGRRVVACVERDTRLASPFPGALRFFGEDEVAAWLDGQAAFACGYVIAIGGAHGAERLRLGRFVETRGLEPLTILHRASFVAETARIGPGCQVLPMAAVCEEAVLGRHTIVNTNASIDHECRLGAGVHVMPGATLAGCVVVEDEATIGSNATILPRLTIGRGARVGAGAVVVADVSAGDTVVGVPARSIDR